MLLNVLANNGNWSATTTPCKIRRRPKLITPKFFANSGGFRLVFDANYQNGWRPKYADYIDADTGEIKKGLGSVERV